MEVKLLQHIRFDEERPVSEILHSCGDMRVILINLRPGQSLPPQTSHASISLQVLSGKGELLSGCEWVSAERGTLRFYPPHEPHGVRASDEPLSVLAVMAPRP